jgi:hypothetical protein
MVYGFTLTDKYLIAAAQRCVVYSHDPLHPGKQADFDIGLNWEVKCHPESNLLLVATWDAAGKVGLWNFENGYVCINSNSLLPLSNKKCIVRTSRTL